MYLNGAQQVGTDQKDGHPFIGSILLCGAALKMESEVKLLYISTVLVLLFLLKVGEFR